MNPEMFVGRVPTIRNLSREDQTELLEKARYEAFVSLRLSGRAAFYMMCSVILGFSIAVIPSLILGFSGVIQLASPVIGILVSTYVHQRLYLSLLLRGLKKVLAKRVKPG